MIDVLSFKFPEDRQEASALLTFSAIAGVVVLTGACSWLPSASCIMEEPGSSGSAAGGRISVHGPARLTTTRMVANGTLS